MKHRTRVCPTAGRSRTQARGSAVETHRRDVLRRLIVGGSLAAAIPFAQVRGQTEEEDVSPAEDLMREHGVLNRILLIYDEASGRLRSGRELDPEVLSAAAGIIRSFIEDYHEKLEEDYLFPRFEQAGRLTDLVTVLRHQHQAGRSLTDATLSLSRAASVLRNPGEKAKLVRSLESFIRMYRPHEAREDTVLFPALRDIVSPNEYHSLGEEFEEKEHELFGEDGFEAMVDRVASLEERLGIYDLSQFTPKDA